MNKKIFSIGVLLVSVLIFASVGCGKKDIINNQKTPDNSRVSPVLNEISGGKSIIDIARERGDTVIDEIKFMNDCKNSDENMQDYCFSLGAIYYRDASFCKLINNLETQKKCNKESIEKWYDDLEKGATSTLATVPGVLIPGGGMSNYDCKAYDSASLCKTAMMNSMLLSCAQNMPQEDKDNCFMSIALQFKDVSFCNKVSDSKKADECKKLIESLKGL